MVTASFGRTIILLSKYIHPTLRNTHSHTHSALWTIAPPFSSHPVSLSFTACNWSADNEHVTLLPIVHRRVRVALVNLFSTAVRSSLMCSLGKSSVSATFWSINIAVVNAGCSVGNTMQCNCRLTGANANAASNSNDCLIRTKSTLMLQKREHSVGQWFSKWGPWGSSRGSPPQLNVR